jgi:hypothetical protein
MSELIFKCIFAVLAVIGTVEVLRIILQRILRTNHPEKLLLTLSVSGHDEQVEFRLRSAVERAVWMTGNVQVVCFDLGMDEETRHLCEMVCADHPEIILCTPEDFVKYWVK